jgi:nitrilase
MSELSTVRVAAVQATPVILDADATVDKAVRLIGEAAAQGARLVVLPENFVALYPSNAWARDAAGFAGWNEFWERFWANGVDGKLMPTMHERIFHGIGAGDDLAVVQLPEARVGGLICWENLMPLARYAMYREGPQIWLAPTADDSDGWLASMRHIAIESGAFVVSVPQYIPASAFPDDFPVPLPEGKEVFGNGGAAICSPLGGKVIAGPLYGAEGIVVADCDLRSTLHAKRWFDAVGHYSREDVLMQRDGPGAGAADSTPAVLD